MAASCFAGPQVSNRPAMPGEIGYRPADKCVAEMNPPSLTWVHEVEAHTYRVQFSRSPDFANAITVSNLPFGCYTHNRTLSPGIYYWRYGFTATNRTESGWSAVRQFEIAADSIPFPLPSKAERRQLVPKGHPRLFVRPEQLPLLRNAAEGTAKADFSQLRSQADRLVGAKLVPEPVDPVWWPNRVQTLQACTEAETVAFVFLLTGETKYGREARRRLLDLAGWNPAGQTGFQRNCEAAKPLLHRIARVYDWCYPVLSESDRKKVYVAVKRRIEDAWASAEVDRGVGGINQPFDSHANRTFHKIGESGIVFLGEIPEAELWLDYALNRFFACYPVWSDADGGWHEGLLYWAAYMEKIAWWLDAIDVALKIDGFRKPFFSRVGDFALYVAPPGSPNMGFGDLSSITPPQSWSDFLDYFNRRAEARPAAGRSHTARWQWWADQWHMTSATGVLGFLYHARLPSLPEPKAPSDLPTAKVFNGTGIASFHNTLLDSLEDVHFLFKSSPFGSISHGFNPQNSVQLNAYGECLLPACVYRDIGGSQFHSKWVHQTISQNAVLVNRQGQLAQSPVPGRIEGECHGPGWDYVCGDAGAAYGTNLTRALRHVLFIKPGIIVMLDELESPRPSTYQFMLHGLSSFSVDAGSQSLLIQQPRAGLRVLYLAQHPLVFKQWDGFDPKPRWHNFPNHWHVEASTVKEHESAAVVTLLVPFKGQAAPNVAAKRSDSNGTVVIQITVDGRKILAAFRMAGAKGPIQLQGLTLDGPVAVLN